MKGANVTKENKKGANAPFSNFKYGD